jgi:DNA-binding MarR family transcriptional regulator
MPSTRIKPAPIAGELRIALGQLVRRLRAEHTFSLSQASVLGRLDRGGPQGVSDLAALERVRPQSMAQTVKDLEDAGLVSRRPDPGDGRRAIVELTPEGLERLESERRHRDSWLAEAIEELDVSERAALRDAVPLLRRLAESDPDAPPL